MQSSCLHAIHDSLAAHEPHVPQHVSHGMGSDVNHVLSAGLKSAGATGNCADSQSCEGAFLLLTKLDQSCSAVPAEVYGGSLMSAAGCSAQHVLCTLADVHSLFLALANLQRKLRAMARVMVPTQQSSQLASRAYDKAQYSALRRLRRQVKKVTRRRACDAMWIKQQMAKLKMGTDKLSCLVRL